MTFCAVQIAFTEPNGLSQPASRSRRGPRHPRRPRRRPRRLARRTAETSPKGATRRLANGDSNRKAKDADNSGSVWRITGLQPRSQGGMPGLCRVLRLTLPSPYGLRAGGGMIEKNSRPKVPARGQPLFAKVHYFRGRARTGEERRLSFTVVSLSMTWPSSFRSLGGFGVGSFPPWPDAPQPT